MSVAENVGLVAGVSAIAGGAVSYIASIFGVDRRVDKKIADYGERLSNVERMVRKLDRRSLYSLKLQIDIANKEGVMQRISDNLGDLLLDEEDGK